MLPEPLAYYAAHGLGLKGKTKWRTTQCVFHGGSDSMRINTATGAWVCMACFNKGGDVLAFEMALNGADFMTAAKALGAWVNDGKPEARRKPTTLPAGQAIQVLAFEATLAAVAAGNLANGVPLIDADRDRLRVAASRITKIAQEFA